MTFCHKNCNIKLFIYYSYYFISYCINIKINKLNLKCNKTTYLSFFNFFESFMRKNVTFCEKNIS